MLRPPHKAGQRNDGAAAQTDGGIDDGRTCGHGERDRPVRHLISRGGRGFPHRNFIMLAQAMRPRHTVAIGNGIGRIDSYGISMETGISSSRVPTGPGLSGVPLLRGKGHGSVAWNGHRSLEVHASFDPQAHPGSDTRRARSGNGAVFHDHLSGRQCQPGKQRHIL